MSQGRTGQEFPQNDFDAVLAVAVDLRVIDCVTLVAFLEGDDLVIPQNVLHQRQQAARVGWFVLLDQPEGFVVRVSGRRKHRAFFVEVPVGHDHDQITARFENAPPIR